MGGRGQVGPSPPLGTVGSPSRSWVLGSCEGLPKAWSSPWVCLPLPSPSATYRPPEREKYTFISVPTCFPAKALMKMIEGGGNLYLFFKYQLRILPMPSFCFSKRNWSCVKQVGYFFLVTMRKLYSLFFMSGTCNISEIIDTHLIGKPFRTRLQQCSC